MRYLPLDFVQPSHILAQPIYDKNFVEQLFDDGALNTMRIEALKRLGYHSVYIRQSSHPDIHNTVSRDTLNALYMQVNAIFTTLQGIIAKQAPGQKFQISIDQLKKINDYFEHLETIGEDLIIQIMRSQGLLHLYETKSLLLYHIQHPVHTSIFAIKIGLQNNLNMKSLRNLFMAAILNDLGYLLIKDFNPLKSGLIDKDQRESMSQHVKLTYEILTQCDSISNVTRTICMQHHERVDGSGYPNSLQADAIHPLAKILSVAIAFDALISDRPFRPAYPIHKGIQVLTSMIGTSFDRQLVLQLSKNIALFPLGTYITYDKKIGCVTHYDDKTQQPLIQFESGDLVSFDKMVDHPTFIRYT